MIPKKECKMRKNVKNTTPNGILIASAIPKYRALAIVATSIANHPPVAHFAIISVNANELAYIVTTKILNNIKTDPPPIEKFNELKKSTIIIICQLAETMMIKINIIKMKINFFGIFQMFAIRAGNSTIR